MLRQGAMEYLHLARRQYCWRDGFEYHAVHSSEICTLQRADAAAHRNVTLGVER